MILNRRSLVNALGGMVAVTGTGLGATACQPPPEPRMPEPSAPVLSVAASFTILADLVREVAGELVTVSSVVGPDQDSHHVDLSPSQALSLAQADVVIRLGLQFDSWVDRALQANRSPAPVLTVTTGLPLLEFGSGRPDPHVWHSATHVGAMARTLATGLAPLLPQPARAGVIERAAAYAQALEAEQRAAAARIKALRPPPSAEAMAAVVPHASFAYLGEALGVQFIALSQLAPGGQLSARGLVELADAVRFSGAQLAFTENVADARLMTQVAEAAGLRLAGQLVSDALTGPQGPAPTLRQLLAHNAQVLEAAFRP
jgi:zinc/manganese transport system substrate-binding protein